VSGVEGQMRLFVGNLPHSTTDEQLRELFVPFGTPESVKVITDRDTGQSKGFGFVEFGDAEEARRAMSLNGKEVGGRALTVNEARPRR
jgi:cold-inducible RNA-binding protein